MWAKVESGSITKLIPRPKGMTIGGTQYPQNIFTMWSSSELEAIGIYEVTIDNTNLKDTKYYINTDQSFTFDSGTVTATYGTATAIGLVGLKTTHKEKINNQAGNLLRHTDWMVIRATEGGTAVPSETTTWRAAVRTKANSMQAQIDGAANVDALAALYEYNDATPPVRPLGEFPVLGA